MSSSFGMFSVLNTFTHLIPTCIITVGCVIYLMKKRNLPGVLLLAGNLLGIVLSVSSTLLVVAMRGGYPQAIPYELYSMVSTVGSLVAGLLFAIGFLLMALRFDRVPENFSEYR